MANRTASKTGKEYVRTMPNNWWLAKRTFLLFIIRELTCVAVGGYALFLLVLSMRAGDEEAFVAMLDSPLLIALQIIALPMVVYHSITWLNLTPKVMVVWRGEERVSPAIIAGANYAAWAVVSIVILAIVHWYR